MVVITFLSISSFIVIRKIIVEDTTNDKSTFSYGFVPKGNKL